MNFIGFYSLTGQGSGTQLGPIATGFDGMRMQYTAVYNGLTPYAIFSVRVNTK